MLQARTPTSIPRHPGRRPELSPTTSRPGIWLNDLEVGDNRILDGVGVGQVATLQVRVWDITKYATYLDAFAHGEYTASAPFLYMVPGAVGSPFAFYVDNLRAFGGLDCPEPSTPMLLALGAVA